MEFHMNRFRFGSPLCSESEIESINEEPNIDQLATNEDCSEQKLSRRTKNIFNLLAFKRKYSRK